VDLRLRHNTTTHRCPDHGADRAFRVEARRGNTVEGRLLVRMDGEWVEANVDGACGCGRLQTK
jgi:hypothetical protein